ncbi:MAG: hypothetical protein IPI73_12395 [Betaproteobacteria bacterium]|nr:hypothetical protein [Betaproteobacteria bacterium]
MAAGVAAALGFHHLDSGHVRGRACRATRRSAWKGAALAALAQRIAPFSSRAKIVQDGRRHHAADLRRGCRPGGLARAVFPAVRQAFPRTGSERSATPRLVADGRDMGVGGLSRRAAGAVPDRRRRRTRAQRRFVNS